MLTTRSGRVRIEAECPTSTGVHGHAAWQMLPDDMPPPWAEPLIGETANLPGLGA